MKRLITGALVALVLFGAPARADDSDNDRVLKIIIVATSPRHPHPYEALRVWLPFETRFTCEEARDEQINTQVIMQAAEKHLQAKTRHLKVRRAHALCVQAGSTI